MNQNFQNDANEIGNKDDLGSMVKITDQLKRSTNDNRMLELLKAIECRTKYRLSQLGSE